MRTTELRDSMKPFRNFDLKRQYKTWQQKKAARAARAAKQKALMQRLRPQA